MKLKLITIFLSLVLLTACSKEDVESPLPTQKEVLQLSVSATGFVTNGADTRIEDDGEKTVFERGDRVGVIVLESTTLKANNLPYVYDGTKWSFDTETATVENKNIYYYDSKATNVTYVVYYPYDAKADNATDESSLKSVFTPKENQQSEADYRASDLMVWTSTDGITKRKLEVQLKHAYASVSVLNQTEYTLVSSALNTVITYSTSSITNVAFVIDGKLRYPYKAEDGSYRYILPTTLPAANVGCFYTNGTNTYQLTLTVPTPPEANKRYAYTKTEKGDTYTYNNINKGDLYCLTSKKQGFVMPSTAITDGLITKYGLTCIGIVFKVGEGDGDDINDENDYDGKLKTIHGYAVALKDAHDQPGAWGLRTYDVPKITNEGSKDANGNFPTRPTQYNGYKNTAVIRKEDGYAGTNVNAPLANSQYWAFKVASDYYVTTPPESSGWYLPSIQQLVDINTFINSSSGALVNAGGTDFRRGSDARYWSANELNWLDAWYYLFGSGNGTAAAYAKSNNLMNNEPSDLKLLQASYVRAILTF
jgi:hypothetical protein